MGGGGQRIDLHPFAIVDCRRNVRRAMAPEIGAQQCVAAVGLRPQRGVGDGYIVRVTRRQDQKLAAAPLSRPRSPTSSREVCQTVTMLPLSEPAASPGGMSMMIGPVSVVLKKAMK